MTPRNNRYWISKSIYYHEGGAQHGNMDYESKRTAHPVYLRTIGELVTDPDVAGFKIELYPEAEGTSDHYTHNPEAIEQHEKRHA